MPPSHHSELRIRRGITCGVCSTSCSIVCSVAHIASSCPQAYSIILRKCRRRIAWLARGDAQSSGAARRFTGQGAWAAGQKAPAPCTASAAYRRAEDDDAVLGIGPVAYVVTQFSHPGRSGGEPTSARVLPMFYAMPHYFSLIFNSAPCRVMCSSCPRRRRDDMKVIQDGDKTVVGM